ncbi:MAG: excinuclease ABC subunit UvrC [Bacillales bacterium]|nr:excinuclease ABC subunit UvrC [Bacillales bacterium]
MNEIIKNSIPLLPKLPGVYLMYNQDNVVIYVGKAKNLYNRVSQYFLRPQCGKVFAMVNNVHHFETLITKTEKEAFILEMNLIHKYYPRYNILLKDGKHYPYIALKKKNDPQIKISHDEKDKNYYYFGPFPTSSYAYEVIRLLNKIFPTRKCKNIPNNPCLYFHMGNCLAPCINKIDESQINELIDNIKSFLNGNVDFIINPIKQKMINYSNNQQYELANECKQTLLAIEHIVNKQNVENNDKTARDVFSYVTRENYLSLAVLTYRNGLLLGKNCFIVEQFGEIEEQILDLILQYYQTHQLPKEIIINIPSIIDSIKDIYDGVNVYSITKGKLLESVDIASLNARQELDSHFMSARLTDDNLSLLNELGNLIKINTPYHIELFDNSHIQGDSAVGAMVAFINGEPNKNMYRKYNLSDENKQDDYHSMQEIIKRRYTRLINEKQKLPDLILVDGGLTQIKAGNEILNSINANIPLFGLFKNDKHQTKGLMDKNGNIYEINNKNLFFLLVRMQDEVHRFAINFHHQKRNKNYKISILDNIKGLGNKRKQILLEHYLSIDALKSASIEELSQLIPNEVAILTYQKLHEDN